MQKRAKNEVFGHYFELGQLDWLDIAYNDRAMFSTIRQYYKVMKNHSKVSKKHFWMIQSVKNEVFGHYLEFGQLDWLDVEYDDRTICISPFSNTTRWWRIIQQSQKSIFEWSKVPKNEVFGHYLEFGLLDWLDIAYDDKTICFPTLDNTTRSFKS